MTKKKREKTNNQEDKCQDIVIRELVVDNHGSGNCAFYAFAIGLIHIIQEEQIYGKKTMFNQWVALDGSVAPLYHAICAFDVKKQNRSLLDILQRKLRFITFTYQCQELMRACAASNADNAYKPLLATSAYIEFAELYYGNAVSHFNRFAKSTRIRNALNSIDESMIFPGEEQLVLAPLFMSLMNNLVSSPVIKAMRVITINGQWGTHLDLDYLARAFAVNLHTLANGALLQKFVDIKARDTIRVNNKSNVHWVTHLPVACQVTATGEKKRSSKAQHRGLINQTASPELNEELQILRRQVTNAVIAYVSYSKKIPFSFFHRHGPTGRTRARDFNQQFSHISDCVEAKIFLLNFLKDGRNGNTYPHSFRTMLAHELRRNHNSKANLQEVSKQYFNQITMLESAFGLKGHQLSREKTTGFSCLFSFYHGH